jgi:hypothetical protein
VCGRARIVDRENAMAGTSVGLVTNEDNVLTLDKVRVMSTAKRGNLKKDQLVKLAINFIAHIDRLESDLDKYKMVFRELRELKKAVFVDATGANAHGDVPAGLTQKYWDTGDRSDIRWDAIHKLAAEQNGSPVATNNIVNVVANVDATSVSTSVEEDDTILRTQAAEAKSLADYREAVKRSQAATQTAKLAKDVQQRDNRQQARERQQREKRERYMKATGRWPTCPIMCGSKTCNRDPCGNLYPAEKFDHPTICRDKSHVVRGDVGKCLLFHFWPQQPKNS